MYIDNSKGWFILPPRLNKVKENSLINTMLTLLYYTYTIKIMKVGHIFCQVNCPIIFANCLFFFSVSCTIYLPP